MTLYLSQKRLALLFLGAFLSGGATALCYLILGLCFSYQPKHKAVKLVFSVGKALRDFFVFAALGFTDAILLFAYQDGRMRIGVFFMNFLGFWLVRYALVGLARRIAKKIKH